MGQEACPCRCLPSTGRQCLSREARLAVQCVWVYVGGWVREAGGGAGGQWGLNI